jgi:hypothetical protein
MKIFLILLLTISLISCSKDEIQTDKPNYSAFLNNRTPSLTGKLNSQIISWKFAWNEFQMFTGYNNGNDIFSITNPVRNLFFGLTSNDTTIQLTFITPKMDTLNQNEIKSVLSVGEKQFGEIYNKFHFRILRNNNFYSNNPNTNQKLEILKTEEFLNYDNKKRLLVWIKIDNLELENANQSGEKIQLKDGYLIAELIGIIFE